MMLLSTCGTVLLKSIGVLTSPEAWGRYEVWLQEAQGIAHAALPCLGVRLLRQVAEPVGQLQTVSRHEFSERIRRFRQTVATSSSGGKRHRVAKEHR